MVPNFFQLGTLRLKTETSFERYSNILFEYLQYEKNTFL